MSYLVTTIGKEALPDVNESGLFNYPCGICDGNDGSIYVADKNNGCIRKIDSRRRITTVFRGLNNPSSIVCTANGMIYVSDTGNNRVLKIDSSNFTLIRAFTGFNSPSGMCYESYIETSGFTNTNIYRVFVADTGNNVIKMIRDEDNTVSNFVTTGISRPIDVYAYAGEGSGYGLIDLFIVDGYRIHHIRKSANPGGTIDTGVRDLNLEIVPAVSICGRQITGGPIKEIVLFLLFEEQDFTNFGGFYTGSIKSYTFTYSLATGVSLQRRETIIPRSAGLVPRIVQQDNVLSKATLSLSYNYASIRIIKPPIPELGTYIPVLKTDDLYISDPMNHIIRKINNNFLSTYAGTSGMSGLKDDIITEFRDIYGIGFDYSGNIYVLDTDSVDIKKITSDDRVSIFNDYSTVPLLFNNDGTYYSIEKIEDFIMGFSSYNYESRILKVSPSNGSRNPINNTLFTDELIFCLIRGNTGKLYTVSYIENSPSVSRISEVNESGAGGKSVISSTGTNFGTLKGPNCICYDSDRNCLYIADSTNHRIRKLDLNTNLFTTIAGTGTGGFNDGAGNVAQFNNPYGVAYDSFLDTLYVADTDNNRIRGINLSDNQVTTVAGTGTRGFNDGQSKSSKFFKPNAIIVSYDHNIYCSHNDRVRKIVNISYKNLGRGVLHENDLYIPSTSPSGIIKIQNVNSNNPTKTLWVSSTTFPSINRPSSILIDGTNMYITNTGTSSISVLENFDTSPTHRFLGINPAVLNLKNADGSLTPINEAKIFDIPSSMIPLGEDLYVVNSGNSTLVKVENFRTATKRAILVANGERNKFTLIMRATMYFDPNNQPSDGTIRFYFKNNINLSGITHVKFSSETLYFKIASSSVSSGITRIIGNFIDDNDNTNPGIIVPPPSSTSTASEVNWNVLLGTKNVMVSQTYTLDNPSDIDMYGSDLYISNLGSRDRNSFITKFGNLTSFRNFIANADRFLGGDLFGMKIHGDHIYASTMNFETGVTRIIRFKVRPWAGSYIFATNESSGGTYNDIIPDNSVVTEIYIPESGSDMYLQVYKFSGGGWDLIRIKNFQ